MRLFAVLLLAAALGAGEVLTPVGGGRQANLNDALGNRWDFDYRSGSVNDGSNDCFDTGLRLHVNGQQFQCPQPMQTKDGELVLSAPDQDGDGVSVTRRIRVEPQLGAVRYLEIVHNASTQARTVTLLVHSCLGSSAQGIVTSTGAAFTGGTLGAKDVGIVATHQPGSRPTVVMILGAPRTTAAAQVAASDNRQIGVTWQLTVPPGKRLAILHVVAQRQNAIDPVKESALLFKAVPKMGMTAELQRLVVNLRLAAAEAVAAGGLPALDRWCEVRGVARTGEDQLVTGADAGQVARGAVRGSAIAVAGTAGKASVPLAEVAAVVGGAGAGEPGRLYLRTGEVLVGQLSAGDLALVAGGGSLAVDPATTPGLLLHGEKNDGREVGAGLVELPDGDVLALAAAPPPTALVGACGVVPVDLALVTQVARLRGDRLGWEVRWTDGSRLTGFLDGKVLALATRRRGAVGLPVHELEGFVHTQRQPPEELDKFDHAELRNGDRLVGALAGGQLVLLGRAGPATVEAAKVVQFTRSGDEAFAAELAGGGQVVGLPQGAGLAVARPGGAVTVPWHALERWAQAKPEEAPPPPEPPADPRLATKVTVAAAGRPAAEVAQRVAAALKVQLAFDGVAPADLPAVTVELRDAAAADVLAAILRDTGLGYRLQGDRLLIQPVQTLEAVEELGEPDLPLVPSPLPPGVAP